MNYYPHHIGDFNSATRHLTRIERSIYRDMIEMYYDTEQALPLDRAALCRKLMARSEEEATAVEQVLNEFFTETEQGWTNGRCDKEIEAYHKKLNDKSAAGKASAAARAANKAPLEPASNKESSTGVQQVLPDCSTNQEPRTKNQEPVETQTAKPATKAAPKFSALDALIAHGVDLQTASDWLAVRKAKNLPATKTALDGVVRELTKAGMTIPSGIQLCCERGWAGFNPSWITESKPKSNNAAPWWSSDALILAEGEKMGMKPHNGEYMPAFKGRVQSAIDNGGKPPAPPRSTVTSLPPADKQGIKPAGLDLKSLIKQREPA